MYLIVSKIKKKTISYVGYTNNLEKRLKLHNSNKGAKFTKGKKWKLIYYEKYNSKCPCSGVKSSNITPIYKFSMYNQYFIAH